ncbi:MAG: hypothetical protein JXB10_20370 [Pirellulales bacterium]|nr:hypothetical protein [Pirellulales bacterium]
MEEHQQIPLWFFIGVLLLIYGVMIAAAGVYYWHFPTQEIQKIMASTKAADIAQSKIIKLHAGVWWGALLTAIGAIYCLRFNPMKKKR